MNIINKWTSFFSNQNIRNSKAAWYQVTSTSLWPCESPEIFTTRSWCILRPVFSGHTWLWDPGIVLGIIHCGLILSTLRSPSVKIRSFPTHTHTHPPTHTHTHTHTPCITHRYEVLTHERGRKWAEVFVNNLDKCKLENRYSLKFPSHDCLWRKFCGLVQWDASALPYGVS